MTDPLPHSVAPRGQDGQESVAIREMARAICRVQLNGGDPDQPAIRWNGTEMEPQEFPAWHDFRDEARAAFAALAKARGQTP